MVAYTDYKIEDWEKLKSEHNGFSKEKDREQAEKGMVLVGIFALMDPLRPGIAEAVDRCKRSGINVRMVTGDNIDTAIAISKEAGILSSSDLADCEDNLVCMTGK
jgi:magnesium-transporting ATPase (P-type)